MEILCMELHKVLSFCPQLTLFLLKEWAASNPTGKQKQSIDHMQNCKEPVSTLGIDLRTYLLIYSLLITSTKYFYSSTLTLKTMLQNLFRPFFLPHLLPSMVLGAPLIRRKVGPCI